MFLLIKLFEWLDSIVVSSRNMREEAPPSDEGRYADRDDRHEGRWD